MTRSQLKPRRSKRNLKLLDDSKLKGLKRHVKKIWDSKEEAESSVNLLTAPLEVRTRNMVLDGPRDGDLREGIHRKIAEYCPQFTQPLPDREGKKKNVARVTILTDGMPPQYVYLVYTRDHWGQASDSKGYLKGLEIVKQDLKKLGEKELARRATSP